MTPDLDPHTQPSDAELDHALACVERTAKAAVLGAFVYEALGTAADARCVVLAPARLKACAARFGVSRSNTDTEHGNLLGLLARVSHNTREIALLSAFAARGFIASLEGLPMRQRAARADRLVARLGWLERASALRVTACLLRWVE
ncbi:MAG: hypothetical protein ABW321_18605, partial [Polyangiales bacterium]